MSTISLDRRAFLGRVTVTAGGVAIASLAPLSLLQAMPVSGFPARVAHDPCGDWTLDDMCAAYPPYSFRVEPGVPQPGAMTAQIDPVDRHWVS